MLKRLSNQSEKKVLGQLAPIANRYGAIVYQKVRIADVIDIDQLPTHEFGRYALQAHFDFTITDGEDNPLFAVEFDGPGHTGGSDASKDAICRSANLGLFRVGAQSLRSEASRLTLVGYLVHMWFLATEFSEMKARAELPADEAFSISGFLRPDAKHIFDSEFDLLGPARGKLYGYCRKNNLPGGPLYQFLLGELLLSRDDAGFVAYARFPLDTITLYGRATFDLKISCLGKIDNVEFVRQEFGQFCMSMAYSDLVEELKLYDQAAHAVRQLDTVIEDIAALRAQGYVALMGLGRDRAFEGAWSPPRSR